MARKQKPRKRANGDGSIYQRADGKWVACVSLGYRDGKRVRKRRVAGSRSQARDKLREMQGTPEKAVSTKKQNVHDYLQWWLDSVVKPNQAPNTYRMSELSVRGSILPNLRKVRLTELAEDDILQMLANMPEENRTKQLAHKTLVTALNHAVKSKKMASNPVANIPRPTYEEKEIWPFTVDEVNRIVDRAMQLTNPGIILIAFYMGLRQGEIFGLQPDDINFEANTMSIRRQIAGSAGAAHVRKLKTKASRRTLQMPKVIADHLKSHVSPDRKWVFETAKGNHYRLHSVYERWCGILSGLKIEHRGMHHARHTFATMMLSNKVQVHVVSKYLGHSKPSITWDIYAHLVPQDQEYAVEVANSLY